MNWMLKGDQSAQALKQQVDIQEEKKKNRAPKRLRVPQMSSVKVIFLDEEGATCTEHAVEVKTGNNNFMYEHYTCLGAMNGCPLCMAGNKPYQVTYYTVIDLTSKWTDKQGVLHQNEKLIYALKTQPAYALVEKKKRWGGLTGKQIIISRKGEQDYASGSDFEPDMREGKFIQYDRSKMAGKEEYKPYDYETIFAPKTPDYIRQALGLTIPAPMKKTNNRTNQRTAGQSAGAFQTMPEGLDFEEVDPSSIPDDGEADVPF